MTDTTTLAERLEKIEQWLADMGGIDTDAYARTISEARAHHTAAQGVTMLDVDALMEDVWAMARCSATLDRNHWARSIRDRLTALSPAPPAPVGEVIELVNGTGLIKWQDRQRPPIGAKLYLAPPAREAPAVPVAWQHRTRTYNDDWGPWKEGRRPIPHHPDYVVEERPLSLTADLEAMRRERDALIASTGEHITKRSEYLARAEAAEAENAALKARVRELAFRIENIVDIDVAVSDHDKIRFILKAVREAAAALQNKDQTDGG